MNRFLSRYWRFAFKPIYQKDVVQLAQWAYLTESLSSAGSALSAHCSGSSGGSSAKSGSSRASAGQSVTPAAVSLVAVTAGHAAVTAVMTVNASALHSALLAAAASAVVQCLAEVTKRSSKLAITSKSLFD
jgi:hypothetical protein